MSYILSKRGSNCPRFAAGRRIPMGAMAANNAMLEKEGREKDNPALRE
jgi:hypothetical protein